MILESVSFSKNANLKILLRDLNFRIKEWYNFRGALLQMKTMKSGELNWIIKDYIIAESIRAGLRGQGNEAGGIFGNELYEPHYVLHSVVMES